MSKYKLVIFDFDGTLADSFEMFLEIWKVAAERYGFKSVTEVDIERLRGLSAREVIAELKLPWWKLPLIAQQMRKQIAKRIDYVKLFDGVGVMLQTLNAKGLKVAIVTSNAQKNVELVLGKEDLELIDQLACGASIFGKKPRTRSVIKASRVLPTEVLCIGDEIRDADVAKELNLDFAAVSWGYTNPLQFEKLSGVVVCKSMLEVVSLVTG
jgi:phosphoglycolate phosphatase